MIDINIEFNKGVLFIRLQGNLNSSNEKNIKENIIKIIREGGIRFLVFNVHNLEISSNVKLFYECEKALKLNDGNMLICGLENKTILKKYKHVDNELIALRTLISC